MSLKIKIPRSSAGPSNQTEEPTIRRKPPKRRSTVLSEEEYDHDDVNAGIDTKPTKRAKTDERSVGGDEDIDVEGDEEVNIEDDRLPDDTRFLPAESAESLSKRGSAKKGKPPPRRLKKRTIVMSDDEGDEDDYGDNQDIVVDDDDDDFIPEPAVSKHAIVFKAKVKGGKAAVTEKKITVRDERKGVSSREGSAFTGRRGVSGGDVDDDEVSKADGSEPVAPLKKRKLPPIKKHKPSTSTTTPSSTAPTKPAPKPVPGENSALDSLALPVAGSRKPAATTNNADFDLRDKSVYASLFMKPGGVAQNSGLSRKEKEEERRKELNKMRDEARAKRAAETKESFDLQSAQEKIARFERRVRARVGEGAVLYPNILGGAFRDAMEQAMGMRVRPQPPPSQH